MGKEGNTVGLDEPSKFQNSFAGEEECKEGPQEGENDNEEEEEEIEVHQVTITDNPADQEDHLMSLLTDCTERARNEYDRVTSLIVQQQQQQHHQETLPSESSATVEEGSVTALALSRLGLRALCAADVKKNILPLGRQSGGTSSSPSFNTTAQAITEIGVKKRVAAPTATATRQTVPTTMPSPLLAAATVTERSHFMVRGLPSRVAKCLNELRCLAIAPPL